MFSKGGALGEGDTKVNNLFIEDVFQGGGEVNLFIEDVFQGGDWIRKDRGLKVNLGGDTGSPIWGSV